jgi:hypothetical protein
VIHGFLYVSSKFKPPRLHVALDVGFQTGLIYGDFAPIKAVDLLFIDVVAHDMVAHFGHAGTLNEANVAGAKNSKAHEYCSSKRLFRLRIIPPIAEPALRNYT